MSQPSILILNGPNLNLLGKREPTVYGTLSFEDFFKELQNRYPSVNLIYQQSNIEGELINTIHQYGFEVKGIVFNPGAYTHTSVALRDAIQAIVSPVVEVHISQVHAREEFRHVSHIGAVSKGTISGLGLQGYVYAIDFLLNLGN
ncbi:MAG: type II 3-dehydroquinate dehydratase [Hydrotalea sp.]|nr:type II 3-dehydroquinate dehydratase [Hydrotalea sp.]